MQRAFLRDALENTVPTAGAVSKLLNTMYGCIYTRMHVVMSMIAKHFTNIAVVALHTCSLSLVSTSSRTSVGSRRPARAKSTWPSGLVRVASHVRALLMTRGP